MHWICLSITAAVVNFNLCQVRWKRRLMLITWMPAHMWTPTSRQVL
jgi:hypothetical protein